MSSKRLYKCKYEKWNSSKERMVEKEQYVVATDFQSAKDEIVGLDRVERVFAVIQVESYVIVAD